MFQQDRVGLPRQFIKLLAKDWAVCAKVSGEDQAEYDDAENAEGTGTTAPRGRKSTACTHGPDASDCQRYCWTSLHKGDWELSLWMDAQPIICISNFFSSMRCGLLSRGRHGSKKSYSVWAPEGMWHYNVEGRSPTDNHDGERGKVPLAERRIVRNGCKGILFVIDIALTNGFIIWDHMKPKGLTEWAIKHKYTKI